MWVCSQIEEPGAEPLDLAEVSSYLKLSADEAANQEQILATLIEGARKACEHVTQRRMITQTLEAWAETWFDSTFFREGRIRLPWPVVESIEFVKYLDSAGLLQTWPSTTGWDSELPEGDAAPCARIFPRYGQSWPPLLCQPKAVQIQFVTGYGETWASVPARLREGMLAWVAERFKNRELSTTGTIISPNPVSAMELWAPFRVY